MFKDQEGEKNQGRSIYVCCQLSLKEHTKGYLKMK